MSKRPDRKSAAIVREAILETVDNQIRDNTPPETRETVQRLIENGYSEGEAKQFVAMALSVEIFHILKHCQPFDRQRYVRNLQGLPAEPGS